MSQAGYTPIQLYYSTTASAAPAAGNLANGELAINITDGKLYYKDNGGVVKVLAGTGGTGVVAGSNTQIQFNNNGVFGAAAGLTWDGTYLTANSIKDSALTSGRVTYAGASGLLQDSANMTFDGTKLTVAGFKDSALTSGRVPYATTSGELIDSANLLYSGTDLTVYGITVGRGAGAVSTNTVVGASALAANTTGSSVTGFGYQAITANTSGNNSVAFGVQALRVNTTGNDNSAFGTGALYSSTTGSANTAIGKDALVSNTTASNNTAVGYQAGYSNTTGPQSVYVGMQAGYNDTGGYNTIVGYNAGYGKTTGDSTTLIGRFAGYASGSHQSQTFVGDSAGYNTTGSNNTFVGINSGYSVSTGTKNTILGSYSGNQSGLDMRTGSNYIVLSDGDGNPRLYMDGSGTMYQNFSTNVALELVETSTFSISAGTTLNILSNQSGYSRFSGIMIIEGNKGSNYYVVYAFELSQYGLTVTNLVGGFPNTFVLTASVGSTTTFQIQNTEASAAYSSCRLKIFAHTMGATIVPASGFAINSRY